MIPVYLRLQGNWWRVRESRIESVRRRAESLSKAENFKHQQ
jgi:hypothetical protein